jgi:flavodoxin
MLASMQKRILVAYESNTGSAKEVAGGIAETLAWPTWRTHVWATVDQYSLDATPIADLP